MSARPREGAVPFRSPHPALRNPAFVNDRSRSRDRYAPR